MAAMEAVWPYTNVPWCEQPKKTLQIIYLQHMESYTVVEHLARLCTAHGLEVKKRDAAGLIAVTPPGSKKDMKVVMRYAEVHDVIPAFWRDPHQLSCLL
jgi:hypothetical protein